MAPPSRAELPLVAPPVRSSSSSSSSSNSWPCDSRTALPPLSDHLLQNLLHNSNSTTTSTNATSSFPVSKECTSLKLSPTGRLLLAGFTDGTVRIFDLTGTYHNRDTIYNNRNNRSHHDVRSGDSDDDDNVMSSDDDDMDGSTAAATTNHGGMGIMVDSKQYQRFGAVACQIHAKGVHTSLLMDVDVSQDGLWCFAGVLRGSVELVAVHLGDLEASFLSTTNNTTTRSPNNNNLLDHVTVHRHQDAKLRGFGACTRLRNTTNAHPEYLLFTGKAIKNLHIWKFVPGYGSSSHTKSSSVPPTWTQLYNTTTNGNTISFLQFRHDPQGRLQGISKSEGQKLRVWDLRREEKNGKKKKQLQHASSNGNNSSSTTTTTVVVQKPRPSKPSYIDVSHTEATLGVAGGQCLCGGSAWYHQLSVVHLDVDRQQLYSGFNHTELALPTASSSCDANNNNNNGNSNGSNSPTEHRRTSRRAQRGDLKCVTRVAGMVADADQVLLELSDGSVVQYGKQQHQPQPPTGDGIGNDNITSDGATTATTSASSVVLLRHHANLSFNYALEPLTCRKLHVGRIGAEGLAVAVVATYRPTTGLGDIRLVPLEEIMASSSSGRHASSASSSSSFWGFLGLGKEHFDFQTSKATAKQLATVPHNKRKADPQVQLLKKKKKQRKSILDLSSSSTCSSGSLKSAASTTTTTISTTTPHKPSSTADGSFLTPANNATTKPAPVVVSTTVKAGTVGRHAAAATYTTPSTVVTATGLPVITTDKHHTLTTKKTKSGAKPRRTTVPMTNFTTPLVSNKATSSASAATSGKSSTQPPPTDKLLARRLVNTSAFAGRENVESDDCGQSHLVSAGTSKKESPMTPQLRSDDTSPSMPSPQEIGLANVASAAKTRQSSSNELRNLLMPSRGPGRPKREDPALYPLIQEHCVREQTKMWREIRRLLDDDDEAQEPSSPAEDPKTCLLKRHHRANHVQLAKRVLQCALRELESVAYEPSVAAWSTAKLSVSQAVVAFRGLQQDLLADQADEWRMMMHNSTVSAASVEPTSKSGGPLPFTDLEYVYDIASSCFANMPSFR